MFVEFIVTANSQMPTSF